MTTTNLIIATDDMFLAAARKLMDAGHISVEQYAEMLRRARDAA